MKSRRFLWLDGSRGIAAIVVMIYHFREYLGISTVFASSYLAVDLFFMMSGFVLAHAYGDKLRAGMSFGRFFAIRMIRLYPVYLAATLLGLSYYVAKVLLQTDDAPSAASLVSIAALNAFFLPNYDPGSIPKGMFPFAPTSWSLSVEVAVSVLFATIFYRLRRSACALIAGISAVVFLVFAVHFKTVDLGWEAKTFAPSVFRATAEFTVGILIYGSISTRQLIAAPRWPAATTFGFLIAALVVMPSGVVTSLIAIAIVFPLAIVFQASSEPPRLAAWLCHQLGRGSYPIYLLHTPVLLWGVGLVKMFAPSYAKDSGFELGLGLVVLTLLASYLCAALDERVRGNLNAFVRRRHPVDPVERVGIA